MPTDSLQQGIEEEGISIYTIKLIFDEIEKISGRIHLSPIMKGMILQFLIYQNALLVVLFFD